MTWINNLKSSREEKPPGAMRVAAPAVNSKASAPDMGPAASPPTQADRVPPGKPLKKQLNQVIAVKVFFCLQVSVAGYLLEPGSKLFLT